MSKADRVNANAKTHLEEHGAVDFVRHDLLDIRRQVHVLNSLWLCSCRFGWFGSVRGSERRGGSSSSSQASFLPWAYLPRAPAPTVAIAAAVAAPSDARRPAFV